MTAPDASGPPVFYRSFLDFLRDQPRRAQRFWVLVVATGAAAGLAATAFLHLLRFVQEVAWPAATTYLGAIEAASPAHRVIVTAIAGVIVTALWLLTRQKLSGHGTPGVIEAIWHREGRISLPRAFLRDASSIVAVSMGASLGREGALIQTSAGAGSWLSQRFALTDEHTRLLVACGAAAGIAAAYNVPIGGSVFGLEVLLGSFALELFGPIVVCCVTATLVSRILIEDHPTYAIPHLGLMSARDFAIVIAMGGLLGIVSAAYTRGMDAIAVLFGRIPRRLAYVMPVVAMAALGTAAIVYPELLGNGYDVVDRSLRGGLPLRLLLVLPALKFVATSVCSSAGVPGGLFTPSLYVGALTGGALGVVVDRLLPGSTPSGAYALVGMGCILAGTTHAAVSSVLIVFELTGDYDVILPLMVACVIAAHVARALYRESIYTASLRRRNVLLPEHARPDWFRATRVAAVFQPDVDVVAPDVRFPDVLTRLIGLPSGRDLYVVEPDGRYRGAIVLDALKGHFPDQAYLRMLVAADVTSADVVPVAPELSLSALARHFASVHVERLPVVDPATGHLVGTVSKNELVRRGQYR